jgi:hypothetical protein
MGSRRPDEFFCSAMARTITAMISRNVEGQIVMEFIRNFPLDFGKDSNVVDERRQMLSAHFL